MSSFAFQDPRTLTIEQQTISMAWCRICRRPGFEHGRGAATCPDRAPFPQAVGDRPSGSMGLYQFMPARDYAGRLFDPVANAEAGLRVWRAAVVRSMADFDQRYGGGHWDRSRTRRPGFTGWLQRGLQRLRRMVRIR